MAIDTPPHCTAGSDSSSSKLKYLRISFSFNFFSGQAFIAESAVPLIIDTDASFDVDDVVAICMAHALMDNGEVITIISTSRWL